MPKLILALVLLASPALAFEYPSHVTAIDAKAQYEKQTRVAQGTVTTDVHPNQIVHMSAGVPGPYDSTPIWTQSGPHFTITPAPDGLTATFQWKSGRQAYATPGVHFYISGQLYKCEYYFHWVNGNGSPADVYDDSSRICGIE